MFILENISEIQVNFLVLHKTKHAKIYIKFTSAYDFLEKRPKLICLIHISIKIVAIILYICTLQYLIYHS